MGAASAIAGGVLSAGAQIASAQQEAGAAHRDAQVKDLQADEVLSRAQINARLSILQGQKLKGDQVAAFAKGGVDVGGGSPLLMLEQTSMEITREVQSIARDAQFEASQLRRGAESSRQQAKDIQTAGKLAATATLFGAGAEASKFSPRGTVNDKKAEKPKTQRGVPTRSGNQVDRKI